MDKKIWLSSPHMGGNEQKFIKEAFDANWIAPLGPNVDGFENAIADYLGDGVRVAALSSGTAALHLALIISGVVAGDEVICQSMTFSASANPISYQGAVPVFIDSEPSTWNLCPSALEDAIKDGIRRGKKPKAIVAVHLYGMPYNHDDIHAIAAKYEIPVIEDSAEALGSSYKGKKCGTLGDISILSFNGNKIITTSGGGAMVTHSQDIKNKAVFLSTQARENAPHYQHNEIGYNYRMSNICAGIGRGQMEVLDDHVAKRREMNRFYKAFFDQIDGISVFDEPSGNYFSNHWLSAILIDKNVMKDKDREVVRKALEAGNIESRPLWKPMHLQPVFSGCPYFGGNISERLFESGLCLPSGSNLDESDKERIAKALTQIFT